MSHDFRYPTWRKKQGVVSITLAACNEAMSGFILLAGFGGMKWMPYVFAALSLLLLALAIQGVILVRSGEQSIKMDDRGITLHRNGREHRIEFQSIMKLRYGRLFEPFIKLYTGNKTMTVYKTMPGYLLFWRGVTLASSALEPIDLPQMLKIKCFRVQHVSAYLAGALLALFVAVQMIVLGARGALAPASAWPLFVLFILVAAAAIWAFLKDWKIVILEPEGIRVHTWFKNDFIPKQKLKAVALEQARVRERITGYVYRGEAMTRNIRYAPAELGLRLRIVHEQGELTLDDSMTAFPIEHFYSVLCRKFQLPGTITMP